MAEPTEIDGKFAFGDHRVNDDKNIPDNVEGVDIGPKSADTFSEVIKGAKTILWNGPMGIFEDDRFADGTLPWPARFARPQHPVPKASSAAAIA